MARRATAHRQDLSPWGTGQAARPRGYRRSGRSRPSASAGRGLHRRNGRRRRSHRGPPSTRSWTRWEFALMAERPGADPGACRGALTASRRGSATGTTSSSASCASAFRAPPAVSNIPACWRSRKIRTSDLTEKAAEQMIREEWADYRAKCVLPHGVDARRPRGARRARPPRTNLAETYRSGRHLQLRRTVEFACAWPRRWCHDGHTSISGGGVQNGITSIILKTCLHRRPQRMAPPLALTTGSWRSGAADAAQPQSRGSRATCRTRQTPSRSAHSRHRGDFVADGPAIGNHRRRDRRVACRGDRRPRSGSGRRNTRRNSAAHRVARQTAREVWHGSFFATLVVLVADIVGSL